MQERNKCLIYMPSFNDTHIINTLIDSINELFNNEAFILIINDGSTVEFPQFHDFANVKVVNLPFNMGVGFGLELSLNYFINSEFDYFLRIDSDGEHSAKDLYAIYSKISTSKINVLFTKRHLAKNNNLINYTIGILNLLGRLYCSLIIFIISKKNSGLIDVNSGMIGMDKRAAKEILKFKLHKYPEPQIFLIANAKDLTYIVEEINASKRTHGKSSINIIRGLYLLLDLTFFTILIGRK